MGEEESIMGEFSAGGEMRRAERRTGRDDLTLAESANVLQQADPRWIDECTHKSP
jgi:hypothetical protein